MIMMGIVTKLVLESGIVDAVSGIVMVSVMMAGSYNRDDDGGNMLADDIDMAVVMVE